MLCVFFSPTTQTFQVGVIVKKIYGPKGRRFNVIGENGTLHTHLPAKEDCVFMSKHDYNTGKTTTLTYEGYVDFELTDVCMPHIKTNLTAENQSNYRDKDYMPSIRKVAI